MPYLLPDHRADLGIRELGGMVTATSHIRDAVQLARRIVNDLWLEFGEPSDFTHRGHNSRNWFGVNAWVYGPRHIDFEVFGMMDSELDDFAFADDIRDQYEAFINRYDWRHPDDTTDHRFHGRQVYLLSEAQQGFRRRTGRVWVYRPWLGLLSPRYRPLLPMDPDARD